MFQVFWLKYQVFWNWISPEGYSLLSALCWVWGQSHYMGEGRVRNTLVWKEFFVPTDVEMWELDHNEGWAPKNWCFWTVVLENTLESPLDCKEVKPINPKGNKPWIFIGRTDAEAKASWPSPTPGVCSDTCPLSQWCHPTISSSVIPFSSCPQSIPASGFL